VVFAPTVGGSASGTLTISVAGSTYLVTLAGTSTVPTTSAAISPSSLSFGSLAVGTTSAAQTVSITNTGTTGMSVGSTSITGPFAITQNYCLATTSWNGILAPGTRCDVSVVFAPTVGGSASGTLTISVAGSTYLVTLAGTGL
jgi:hypothetical protein